MLHETLTARLLAASDFIEVAAVVCSVGRCEFAMCRSVVTLQALDGRPLLMVDDETSVTDDVRLAWTGELWRQDPLHVAMRHHHAPVGDEFIGMPALDELRRELGCGGEGMSMLLLPILQTGELLGTIRFSRRHGFSPELRRDLTTLSSHVSVRLAQLGVTTLPHPILAEVTPRQRDVAQLVARGYTYNEIGASLGLTTNVVKKDVKDVFEVLGLVNRTDLAARVATGPQHQVPVGVSRRGDLWVTHRA